MSEQIQTSISSTAPSASTALDSVVVDGTKQSLQSGVVLPQPNELGVSTGSLFETEKPHVFIEPKSLRYKHAFFLSLKITVVVALLLGMFSLAVLRKVQDVSNLTPTGQPNISDIGSQGLASNEVLKINVPAQFEKEANVLGALTVKGNAQFNGTINGYTIDELLNQKIAPVPGTNGRNGKDGINGNNCGTGVCISLQASTAGVQEVGNLNITGIVMAAAARFTGLVSCGTLTTDASGNVVCSSGVGVINGFIQGGNSFGVMAILGTNDLQPLSLRTNRAEAVRIDTNGNVGIGTATPSSSKLVISNSDYGQLSLKSTAPNGNNDIEFVDGNAGTIPVQIFTNSAQGFSLWTNGHGSFLVDPNGLTIINYNAGTQGGLLLRPLPSQSRNSTALQIGDGIVTGGTQTFIAANPNSFTGNFIDFQIGGNGSGITKFKVDNSGNGYFAGNVGVGSTTPAREFHILSTAGSAGLFKAETNANSLNAVIELQDSSAGQARETSLNFLDSSGSANIGQLKFQNDPVAANRFFALRLSDSTSTSQERLRITSAGNVGIGTSSPAVLLNLSSNNYTEQFNDSYFSGISQEPDIKLRKARGTAASPADVLNGDNIGVLFFNPYVNGNFRNGAAIRGFVDGTPNATSYPAGLNFYSTADGSTSYAVAMTIKGNGNVGIGTTSPNSKLQVDSTSNFAAGTTSAYSVNDSGSADPGGTTNRRLQTISLTNNGNNPASALAGAEININQNASATASSLVGTSTNLNLTGNGSVVNAYGYRSLPLLQSSANVTNYYGFEARTPVINSTGVLSNAYGLFLGTQKIAGVTNAYGIYQNGANDLNYFAGNVGIGTSTPNDKLEVNGIARVNTLGVTGTSVLCYNASNQISTCGSGAGSGSYIFNGASIQTNANFYIQSNATGSATAILKAKSGQTADLLSFQDEFTNFIGGFNTGNNIAPASLSVKSYGSQYGTALSLDSTPASGNSWNIISEATTGTKVATGNLTLFNSTGSRVGLSLQAAGGVLIPTSGSANIGLTIKANAAQTADLLQLQDSTGQTKVSVLAPGSNFLFRVAGTGNEAGAQFVNTSSGTGQTWTISSLNSGDLNFAQNAVADGRLYLGSDGKVSTGAGAASGTGKFNAYNDINASTPGLVIKGFNSQSADLLQIQSSAGTILSEFSSSGTLGLNNTSAPNPLSVNSLSTGDATAQVAIGTNGINNKGLVIQGIAGQSADLLSIQTSTGATRLRLSPASTITATSTSNSPNAFQVQNSSQSAVFDVDTSNRRVGINVGNPTATLQLAINADADVGQIVQAHSATQSADLFQSQTSTGTLLSGIASDGSIYVQGSANTNPRIYLAANGVISLGSGLAGGDWFISRINSNLAQIDGKLLIKRNGGSNVDSLQVQTSTGAVVLGVDTTNQRVGIGNAAPVYSADILGNSSSNNDGQYPVVHVTNLATVSRSRAAFELSAGGSGLGTIYGGVFADGIGEMAMTGSQIAIALGTVTSSPVVIATNNSARVTVNATGNVGIGNVSPSYPLDVTGSGRFTSTVFTSQVDTNTSIGLNIGTTNASALALGNNANNFNIDLYSGAGGIINVVTSANAHTVNIASGAATQAVTIGSTNTTSSLLLQSGSGNTVLSGGNVGIGDTTPGSLLSVGNGHLFQVSSTGTVVAKNSTDSTAAFQVQNAAGTKLFNLDTANSQVSLGTVSTGVLGGANGIFSNTYGGSNGKYIAMQVRAGTTTTVNQVSVYVGTVDPVNNQYQVAVYSDNSNSPGTLLATSAQASLTPNSWNTVAIPSTAISAGSHYWLAYATNTASAAYNNMTYIPNDQFSSYKTTGFSFGSFPASNTFGTTSTDSNAFSIYASSSSTLATNPIVLNSAGEATFSGPANFNDEIRLNGSTQAIRTFNGGSLNLDAGDGGNINLQQYGGTVASFNNYSSSVNEALTISGVSAGNYTSGVLAINGFSGQTQDLVHVNDGSSNTVFKVNATGSTTIHPSSNSTSAFQIQDASGAVILAIDTTTKKLTVKDTVINGVLTVNGHVITGNTSGNTTVAANTAVCGTGCTVTISGNDTSGVITVNTGTGVTAGTLGTITFSSSYGAAPKVILTPANVPASSTFAQYYYSSTTTTFDLKSYNAITDSKTYTFSYHTEQ